MASLAALISEFSGSFKGDFNTLCRNNGVDQKKLEEKYTTEHLRNVLAAGSEGNWSDFLRDAQVEHALGKHQDEVSQANVSASGMFGQTGAGDKIPATQDTKTISNAGAGNAPGKHSGGAE